MGGLFHHQFKDAAQIFQQVLKDEPDFVPAYLSLGRCMILQDQEAQGLEILLEGFRKTGEGTFLQASTTRTPVIGRNRASKR